MTEIIDQNDLLMLFRLLAAHMFAEWVFQWSFWKCLQSKEKWFSIRHLLQSVVGGTLAYLFAGSWSSIWLLLVIFISRFVIDGWKYKKGNVISFSMVKQIVHLLVIVGCWFMLVGVYMTDIITLLDSIISNVKLWTVGLSYIIVIWPAGVWIGKITEPWRKELDQKKFEGLAKAGLWMGRLERILILTFVLLDHYDAIGFLIAAKSIFRFSEISSSKDRKEAEYILIGTMLSFVVAILIGIFATLLLKQFQS